MVVEQIILMKRNIKVKVFGDLDTIDKKMAESFRATMEATKNNTALNFNVCFNYGGRAEITKAVKQIIIDEKKSEDINEELISSYLYSADQPEPDMIVRTSGEHQSFQFFALAVDLF